MRPRACSVSAVTCSAVAPGSRRRSRLALGQHDDRKRYEGLRVHDLRHTAVAFWIAAGASPVEIARRAGHSSTVTVLDRYGHLLPSSEDHVTDALDAMATAAQPARLAQVVNLPLS